MGMKPLPLPEVKNLIQKLPSKYQAIIAIGVTTGCRITEILSIRRFDLLDREGKLKDKISFIKLKTRCDKVIHRKLSIPKKYHKFILNHLIQEEKKGYDRPDDLVFRGKQGKPLSRITVYSKFREYLGEGFGTHWMRKTFAKELFNFFLKDNPSDPMRALTLTEKALGHKNIDTTILYLGIREESIENAQNEIFNKEDI